MIQKKNLSFNLISVLGYINEEVTRSKTVTRRSFLRAITRFGCSLGHFSWFNFPSKTWASQQRVRTQVTNQRDQIQAIGRHLIVTLIRATGQAVQVATLIRVISQRDQIQATGPHQIVILTQVIGRGVQAAILMPVTSLRDQTRATGPHRIVILTQVIAQGAQVVILMRVISRRERMQVIDQPLTVTQMRVTVLEIVQTFPAVKRFIDSNGPLTFVK